MKNFSFYEQLGVLIPGSVLLFGAACIVPEIRAMLVDPSISVGGLGVFLLVAYACGQLLAALGNVIEKIYWSFFGGMPTNWVVGPKSRLLSKHQIIKLETNLRVRLGFELLPLHSLDRDTWFPISREIFSDVEMHGNPKRIEIFNGSYGLNRGLSAATCGLALIVLALPPHRYIISGSLLLVSAVYLFRMHRFGVHYARELYNQFLLLPSLNSPSETDGSK